jgi:hypothetical protein
MCNRSDSPFEKDTAGGAIIAALAALTSAAATVLLAGRARYRQPQVEARMWRKAQG